MVTLFYTKSAGASHTYNIHSHRFKVRLSCTAGHEPGNGQPKQLFAQPSVPQSSMAEVLWDSWIMGTGLKLQLYATRVATCYRHWVADAPISKCAIGMPECTGGRRL
jgi:hypothetical protein